MWRGEKIMRLRKYILLFQVTFILFISYYSQSYILLSFFLLLFSEKITALRL